MYLEKIYKYADIIEIHKTYSCRYGNHSSRENRQGTTKKAVAAYNEKLARRELARTIKANFEENDIHLTLTYKKHCRPCDIGEAKKLCRKFLDRLKKICGAGFKYIHSASIGTHGAIHHHLIISYLDPREFRKLWQYGSCYISYLDGGDYTELARYILGQKQKSANPEQMCGRRWSSSRNVKRVKPVVKEIKAKTWIKTPAPIKGYIVDVDSIESGINPITGIPYIYYRLRKVPPLSQLRRRCA